jgi:hypothetical protein
MALYLWVVLVVVCHKMETETGIVDCIYHHGSEREEAYKVLE